MFLKGGVGGHKTLHIIILCARAKDKRMRSPKKGLRIHEMKKGLKKKRYIYWLDEGLILFYDKQVIEKRPNSSFSGYLILIIFHHFFMDFEDFMCIIHHFL